MKKYLLLFYIFLLLLSCNNKNEENVLKEEVYTNTTNLNDNVIRVSEQKQITEKTDTIEIKELSVIDIDLSNSFHDKALSELINNGDLFLAEKNINKAILLNPKNPDSYYIKGNILEKKGDFSNALLSYKETLQIDENHIDANMKTAICYGRMNDMSNFCVYAEKACELGNTDACNGIKQYCN
jgi:Flp pilus assembly protein TadD